MRKVLLAQQYIREHGPDEVREISLITVTELQKIRQIWVTEKHEIEDRLPVVYEDATGEPFPCGRLDDSLSIGGDEIKLLRNLCDGDELHFQLARELLSIENQHKSMLRRSGLFDAFENAFRRNFYDNEEDALDRARQRKDALDNALDHVKYKADPEAQEAKFSVRDKGVVALILDEITLTDFGLYAGNQCLELTPPSTDKPVILIGGLNGGGKTTLLDALQLCLFGPHAKTSNRGTRPYREYLSSCIHRQAKTPESGVSVRFRHTNAGVEECYSLYRSWRKEDGTCREFFQVMKNGVPEPTLGDNWFSHMEDLFPPRIAHLFFIRWRAD